MCVRVVVAGLAVARASRCVIWQKSLRHHEPAHHACVRASACVCVCVFICMQCVMFLADLAAAERRDVLFGKYRTATMSQRDVPDMQENNTGFVCTHTCGVCVFCVYVLDVTSLWRVCRACIFSFVLVHIVYLLLLSLMNRTRSVIPLLKQRGVNAISVGCNGGSMPPAGIEHIPNAFVKLTI